MKCLALALLLSPLLLCVGCGDDSSSPTTPVDTDDFVASTTPDLAMQNFEVAWENLNFVEYSKLLATEFQFFFDPADNLEDLIGGPSWQLADELASTQAMFSNQAGVDPVTQEVIPPIQRIEFQVFVPMDDEWQHFPDDESQGIYRNTFRQRYQVDMRVTYQGEELTTIVQRNSVLLPDAGRGRWRHPLFHQGLGGSGRRGWQVGHRRKFLGRDQGRWGGTRRRTRRVRWARTMASTSMCTRATGRRRSSSFYGGGGGGAGSGIRTPDTRIMIPLL